MTAIYYRVYQKAIAEIDSALDREDLAAVMHWKAIRDYCHAKAGKAKHSLKYGAA